jgi:uncharacterized protein (TIGR03083 family)
MDHLDYLDRNVADATALANAASAVGPDTAVPATPGWTIAKLVKHTGTLHRWAQAATTSTEFPNPADLDLGLPDSREEYPVWLRAGALEFREALAARDPEAPCWSWGGDQHVRFWSRRMAHETAVHRWDAEGATGARAAPIDPEFAVDGIDERLEHLVPSMIHSVAGTGPLHGQGESVHLHCTDVPGEWLLRFDVDGFTFSREHAKGDVAVRGPAAELLLFLVGRRELGGLEVFGDTGVLEAHDAIRRF